MDNLTDFTKLCGVFCCSRLIELHLSIYCTSVQSCSNYMTSVSLRKKDVLCFIITIFLLWRLCVFWYKKNVQVLKVPPKIYIWNFISATAPGKANNLVECPNEKKFSQCAISSREHDALLSTTLLLKMLRLCCCFNSEETVKNHSLKTTILKLWNLELQPYSNAVMAKMAKNSLLIIVHQNIPNHLIEHTVGIVKWDHTWICLSCWWQQ